MKQFYPSMDESSLLQFLQGLGTPDDRERIGKWLARSSRNRERLNRLESLWLETGKLDPPPVAVDVQEAWRKISARMDHEVQEAEARASRVVHLPAVRLAMAAAALVLLTLGVYLVVRLAILPGKTIEITSATTPVRDTLPDGTRVTLNRGSRLYFPRRFHAKSRDVRMQGEVFFEVSHDSERPFLVEAGNARIRVLGTAFDVKEKKEGSVEVSVSEGTVLFFSVNPQSRDTLSVILTVGEQGLLRAGSYVPEKITGNFTDLFWYNKSVTFRHTPLSEVLEWLQNRYKCRIRVTDPGILECRLTASFRDESPDQILMVIGETFGLTVRNEAGTYVLAGHGCH